MVPVGEAPASSTACPHVPQGAGWPEGLVHNSTGRSPIDAGAWRRPVALALGLALEFAAIGVVDNAIGDRVRDRGLSDHLWSAIHGDLADCSATIKVAVWCEGGGPAAVNVRRA